MNKPTFEESPILGNAMTYLGMILLSIVFFVVGFFISVHMFLIGRVGFFVGIGFWSTVHYYTIALSSNQLHIGKERIPLSEFDNSYGAKPAEEALENSAQLGSLELNLSPRPQKGMRILGGGWGRPKNGATWAALRESKSGDLLFVAVKQREQFIAAMNTALQEAK